MIPTVAMVLAATLSQCPVKRPILDVSKTIWDSCIKHERIRYKLKKCGADLVELRDGSKLYVIEIDQGMFEVTTSMFKQMCGSK